MFTVFTTMSNGELRSYSVDSHSDFGGRAQMVIDIAREMDRENYPDNPSSFENVAIMYGGTQVYDLVWGEPL